ncbi:hypothetical protein SESBI_49203 [Sesbania bispinosa]|nr:hypothetical protein SESBI_49203 [Sesbania bispinosa]
MDCNKEEALRAKDIAEKKMESRDFMGARKFALKAQQLYPDLENIAQMLVVCDVHCSAEMKLFGNEMDWPFIAYNVDRKSTPSATNSSQQAFGQQKDGLNHGPSKMGGSQGNLHAEKSNTGLHEKKGPVDVSGKPHGKRKRNKLAESSQSSDFTSSTDSEGGRVVGEDGVPGVENHSTYREEQPRRSARQKHKVSYKDNVSDNDDDLLRPSKRGKECGSPCGDGESQGERIRKNDQNGLAAEESLRDRNEETKVARGKAVGGSKQMDETSEHSFSDLASKATNHPNAYVYFEAEFSDFDKDKKKECFVAGQIWAVYDTTHGMPRFYALIRKVLSPRFKLQITWLESHPGNNDEMKWVNEDMPVACGKYKLGDTNIMEDHLIFSHVVTCEKIGRNTFKVYPRKGETWALLKIGISNGTWMQNLISSMNMSLLKSCQIMLKEVVDVPVGSYELDPAALPMNLEESAVPENLDVKFGHSSGTENTRSSERSKPPMTSDREVSTPKVNLKRSNLAENKDFVDDIDDCHAPPASTPEAIVVPDTQFFNFDAERSLEKFQIGQIWAFYSDEDGLPKYYGQIDGIETSPHLELHVSWLACCWLPENTTRWEDKDMAISCGRFKVNKRIDFLSVYSGTDSVSHQVHADAVGNKKNYAIFPRKGEVWALYRKWSNKIKCSDLKNWEYDIVEVLEETDLFTNVLVLEFASGFSSIFRGKSNEGSSVNLRIPRKELLRFSHRIPAFKLTEEHGNLSGFLELDPGALPIHYYGLG